MITFNKPYFTGKETKYIVEAVKTGKISGNGIFTEKCQHFFEEKYGFKKCLLTSSCTDALEMAAILCDIQPGDEVIIPSYTFVSTALAFVRQGAKIVFADCYHDHPNIDHRSIEKLISTKTKAIVVVHYSGFACEMDSICKIVRKYNLFLIEDAAQSIDAQYVNQINNKKMPLGSIGHLSTFSFHETKNIITGEGGMLVVNDNRFLDRSEIIWEKGTNRSRFFRGEIDKYGWVDTGSSFLPSEIMAAFLFAQLEEIESIQQKRRALWDYYYNSLKSLEEKGLIELPKIPIYATNNAHIFYIVCNSLTERSNLIKHLSNNGVQAVFHYQCLHKSEFYLKKNNIQKPQLLINSDRFENTLLRLPLFVELTIREVQFICDKIMSFFLVR